jgi:hypothetical protein
MNTRRFAKALAAGAVGACALTLIHELMRRTVPRAPRMDLLGVRGLVRVSHAAGFSPPERLHESALLADLVSNAAYYSLVGAARGHEAAVGAGLGVAAGAGAVLLPVPLGLGSTPSARTVTTQVLTVGLYTVGGIIAGACLKALTDDSE